MSVEAFRFDGKRALVVGGASGMGEAAANILRDLGAEVFIVDRQDADIAGAKAIRGDLREKESIDAALSQIGGPVDALLCCAGVADGDPGLEKSNFIGHRYVIDQLFAQNALPAGSAIGMISSTAALGWENHLPQLLEFLDTPDFDAASAWIAAHEGTATYTFTKRAMCAYVARQAFAFLKRGVRINAIMPGPTNTPLARANAETWLGHATDYRDEVGITHARPDEQGYPLVFLCSAAASYITGVNLVTDAGYASSGFTGSFDSPIVRWMLGLS